MLEKELKEEYVEKSKVGTKNEYQQLFDEYEKKFGGFPYYLLMGASKDFVIKAIKEALDSGKEISINKSDIDY